MMAQRPSLRVVEADPAREAERLVAVRRYDILDTPPDGAFDRITALAADLFAVPISIISLVDHDRIWFKSHFGLEAEQIDREPGLCASAILQRDPWILNDATLDPRSLANPLVAGDFGLRFYVGVPLRTMDGFNLGTLCVIDREPREVSSAQIEHLKVLASVVMDQMELRLSARRALSGKDLALQRSEMLAREIDHRVMNSLQLVSGLLRMQARGLMSPEAARELAIAADRVSAVARVHQHIYMSDRIASVNCMAYLQGLCGDLAHMLGRRVVLKAALGSIATAQVISVGLIVNELVTNSIKNGAENVTVTLQRSHSGFTLSVRDDGAGLPAGFDPATSGGLGMKVIAGLVADLEGQLDVGRPDDNQGAVFHVHFPALEQ